ncbi:MAG TPA: CarD family transcriptional regulator, partial [Pirellulales bacterium]|nr:CarD family transcriptional regulator [Pirellulales bacterium]
MSNQLWHLVGTVFDAEGFDAVATSLRAGHGATLDGVRGSASALVAAALAERCSSTLVVVCAHPGDIDDFVDDLAVFTPRAALKFPAWEALDAECKFGDELCGDRLRALKSLAAPQASRILVTSIQSLVQPVPTPERIVGATRRLAVGETLDVEALVRWLIEQGFQSTSAVALPGELSIRGGILDLFAPDWLDPVRIELFGDQIESIRRFEVSAQRSLEVLDSIAITALGPASGDRAHFADHLPSGSWFMLLEPGELEEEGRHYLGRVDDPAAFHTVSGALRSVYRFPSVTAASLSIASMETTCRLKMESVERFSGDIAKVRHELDTTGIGQQVYIVCQTEAEIHRLGTLCAETQLAREGKLHFLLGRLRAGFRLVIERIVLISGNELFHRADVARPTRRRLGRVIDSFLELREGDYVVHVAHGIGKYRGLKLVEVESQTEEHLELEFDGGTKL